MKKTNADIYGSVISQYILTHNNHNFGINKNSEEIFICDTTNHTCKNCIFNVHNAPKLFGAVEYTTCQAYKADWIKMEYEPKLTENDVNFLKLIYDGGTRKISLSKDFPNKMSLYKADHDICKTAVFQREIRMSDYGLTFEPLKKLELYNIAQLLNEHKEGKI